MNATKQNRKRAGRPTIAPELRRSVNVSLKLRPGDAARFKAAAEALRDQMESAAVPAPNAPAPTTRLPRRLSDSLARFVQEDAGKMDGR